MSEDESPAMSGALLVPVKLDALVIDDKVLDRFGFVRREDSNEVVGGDGRWSHQPSNYERMVRRLDRPGPEIFFGAERRHGLGFARDSAAAPGPSERGVYLHWVLPPELRHGGEVGDAGTLSFPALPDQWVLLRFARQSGAKAGPELRAWFIDGGACPDEGRAKLIVRQTGTTPTRVARCVGAAVPLEQLDQLPKQRVRINALGNDETGSPCFSAFTADNRNTLSFFDDLGELRDADGRPPPDLALSYQLVGWYADADDERRALARLRDRRGADSCVFHATLAQINFWNPEVYKGPMLGYPGAPSQHAGSRGQLDQLQVGVGFDLMDALLGLLEGGGAYGDSGARPAMWEALEAVSHRHIDTLVEGADDAPLSQAVRRAAFEPLGAGSLWSIRAARRAPRPALALEPEPETGERPTASPAQLESLAKLNATQRDADRIARRVDQLQHDLYGCWWWLSRKRATARPGRRPSGEREGRAEALALADQIAGLRTRHGELDANMQLWREQLRASLDADELELIEEPAPRFWAAKDPFVLVSGMGLRHKHVFEEERGHRLAAPGPLELRVTVDGEERPLLAKASLAGLRELLRRQPRSFPAALELLLEEAAAIEAGVATLAAELAPAPSWTEGEWTQWLTQLREALAGTGTRGRLWIARASEPVETRSLKLWGRQPFSPLFMDWRITWHPTGGGQRAAEAQRFEGRSLASAVDPDRLIGEPLEPLRAWVDKQLDEPEGDAKTELAAFLDGHLQRWRDRLAELRERGLLGQHLEGFGQTLAGCDSTLPRVRPDPELPWQLDAGLETRVHEALRPLSAHQRAVPSSPRRAPPRLDDETFALTREGSFTLDELWLIDDFGQWCDLLAGSGARDSAGVFMNPRLADPEHGGRVVAPPALLQPARLDFRFTQADDPSAECVDGSPAGPIHGWVFHHLLDRTLVVCDASGGFIGELERGPAEARWRAADPRAGVADISSPTLRAFVERLLLADALAQFEELLDSGLAGIRPTQARRGLHWLGRPLALVGAHLELQLFGERWRGLRDEGERRPVRLGRPSCPEDGLVGYYLDGFERIIPAWSVTPPEAGGYIAHADRDGVRLRVGERRELVLLMEPRAAVEADPGLLPPKRISLPTATLARALERLEVSFRVGPLLVSEGRLDLATPIATEGHWRFVPADGDGPARSLDPFELGPTLDERREIVAVEGRLLHEHDEPADS